MALLSFKMSKNRSRTAYLFVNKDVDSASLSRSHGKDASAILSHVQSYRSQKNKQLHLGRIDTTPDSVAKTSSPPLPSSPVKKSPSSGHCPLRTPPTLRSETSSSSGTSAQPDNSEGSPRSPRPSTPDDSAEVDELVQYYNSLCLASTQESAFQSLRHDLFDQIFSSQDYPHPSREVAGGIHGFAMLACTAAKMGAEMPSRREEFEIKATKYMQPSIQSLREQLANPHTRTLTDRQILQEMLLHCVANWYLLDFTAAQTHLNAIGCFSGCLDVTKPADRKLMDVIHQCRGCIANSRRTEKNSRRSYGKDVSLSTDRGLAWDFFADGQCVLHEQCTRTH